MGINCESRVPFSKTSAPKRLGMVGRGMACTYMSYSDGMSLYGFGARTSSGAGGCGLGGNLRSRGCNVLSDDEPGTAVMLASRRAERLKSGTTGVGRAVPTPYAAKGSTTLRLSELATGNKSGIWASAALLSRAVAMSLLILPELSDCMKSSELPKESRDEPLGNSSSLCVSCARCA